MEIIVTIFGIVLLGICIILVAEKQYDDGYKNGQIDAIKDIIKYTLVEFKDGTREYLKTKDLKDWKDYTIIDNQKQNK